MLCGPSSTSTTVRSAISFSSLSRAAVDSKGRIAVGGAVDDQRRHVDLRQVAAEVRQPCVDAGVARVRTDAPAATLKLARSAASPIRSGASTSVL